MMPSSWYLYLMTEHNSTQALLLLDARQATADLDDMVSSIETIRNQGHRIDIDQIWLDQYAELPPLIPSFEHIPIQRLTPEAIEQLSKVELNRYDSVESEQLSLREFIFRVPILSLREAKVTEDQVYRTMVDRLTAIGGAAVVTGTAPTVRAVTNHYEALCRDRRPPPQGRARFPYH